GATLYKHLRHRFKHRKRPISGKKVVILDKVSIDFRTDIINEKRRFGDWEFDTIADSENKGSCLTVTERQTGFLLTKKLRKGKSAKSLAREFFYFLLPYKRWERTITSGNGSEFYEHKYLIQDLNAGFFFAPPYSSMERGLNGYTNGLVRQYIPKKQNFNNFNDDDINSFQIKINKRPRKLLNFDAPIDCFYTNVALTN
ncbi:MAG: IS30 family transposase, partial [Prevotellaceae bacterium]|nr:IS30 family transposase [Prevotellaceae bacterium]